MTQRLLHSSRPCRRSPGDPFVSPVLWKLFTCYGSAYAVSGQLPATSCQVKCNMVITGTSVVSYRRRHSWHSLLFLPLPVGCVTGIARASESRRTNLARSLCGRFRERSIAYGVHWRHSISSSNIRPGKTVSSRLACGSEMALIAGLLYLSVAWPCNEAVRCRRWREIRVRHTILLVARRDQTTSVIKQQPRRSGPCVNRIVSSPSSTPHARLPPFPPICPATLLL